MTGIRRTLATDKVTVLVEAYHRLADGEVQRVDFVVTDSNGVSTQSVTSRSLTAPDDTDITDPLPGWSGSGPGKIWGFAYDVLMTRPAGTITVDATVVPTQGTSFSLPRLTIYNHKNGLLPPSTNVIWCSPTGDDTTGTGSQTAPVRSIQKACTLASTGGDAGGATVYLTIGTHLWARGGLAGSYGQPSIITSGHHWLRIESAPGLTRDQVIVTRQADADDTWLAVSGPTTDRYEFRLRLRNVTIEGKGLVVANAPNVSAHAWLDGCAERSPFVNSIHVGAYDTDSQGMAVANSGFIFVTGGYRHHVINGWHGAKMVRGCRIENWIGIVAQCTSSDQGVCNVYIGKQRYKTGVDGWFDPISGLFDITVPSTGVMRVTARNSSVPNFVAQVTNLIGLVKMGVKVDGIDDSVNYGAWQVLGAGNASGTGYPYVTLANPDAVPESPPTNLELRLARVPDGAPWEELIHPDVLHVNTNPANYSFTNVRAFDLGETQGLFGKNRLLTRCAFVNVAASGDLGNSWFIVDAGESGGWNHVIMRHVTCIGVWHFERRTNFTYADSEVYDCVFDEAAFDNGSTAPPVAASNNHFQAGVSFGSNASVSFPPPAPTFWADANYATSGNYSAKNPGPGYQSASQTWTRPATYSSSPPDRDAWTNVAKDPTQGGGWV